MLGAASMEAGRFLSARQSFDDALALGDESPRTALGFALSAIATGDRAAAIGVLEDWRDEIPAADLGLALALAGQAEQGALILSNAVRNGDNTPKSRQNLAYSLALSGNWAAARIMAAEDVPADQLDARIIQWASMARPEDAPVRVATLLGTRSPILPAMRNSPQRRSAKRLAEKFRSRSKLSRQPRNCPRLQRRNQPRWLLRKPSSRKNFNRPWQPSNLPPRLPHRRRRLRRRSK